MTILANKKKNLKFRKKWSEIQTDSPVRKQFWPDLAELYGRKNKYS